MSRHMLVLMTVAIKPSIKLNNARRLKHVTREVRLLALAVA
jgi:hypothetical protein